MPRGAEPPRPSGRRPRVAVYGGANADIQGFCYRPYKAGDSNPGRSTMAAGGVGRNIAENLARLGAETELVTVFGDDNLADFIRVSCDAVGLRYERSVFLNGEPSPRYLCILDADGGLVGAVAAMDALERFGPEALAARYAPGDEADAVVLDANLPAETLLSAAERWRDKPLLLDTVSEAKAGKARGLLPYLAAIKPNRAEASLLTGLAEPAAAAAALLSAGVREAFVSLGAGGLLWLGPDGGGIARPPSLPVVNVSGAGDALSAALAWGAALGLHSKEKARLAMAAAGLCAASAEAVNPALDARSLYELARGVRLEPLS